MECVKTPEVCDQLGGQVAWPFVFLWESDDHDFNSLFHEQNLGLPVVTLSTYVCYHNAGPPDLPH